MLSGTIFYKYLSELFSKMLICILPVLRFIQLVIITIFFYGSIGVEVMNPMNETKYSDIQYFVKNEYTSLEVSEFTYFDWAQ